MARADMESADPVAPIVATGAGEDDEKALRTMAPPTLIWSSAIRTTNATIAYWATLASNSVARTDADVAANRCSRATSDETREVCAEGEDQQRHHHVRDEQDAPCCSRSVM